MKNDRLVKSQEQAAHIGIITRTSAKGSKQRVRTRIQVLNSSDLPIKDVKMTVVQWALFGNDLERVELKYRLSFEFEKINPHEARRAFAELRIEAFIVDGSFAKRAPEHLLIHLGRRGITTTTPFEYVVAPTEAAKPSYAAMSYDGAYSMQFSKHGKVTGYSQPEVSFCSLIDNKGLMWEIRHGAGPKRIRTGRRQRIPQVANRLLGKLQLRNKK